MTTPQPVDNLARSCPTCDAGPGDPCTTTGTNLPMGSKLTHRARPKPRKRSTAKPRANAGASASGGPPMSEAELGREVAKLAKRGGWRGMHVRRGRRSDGGWDTATSVSGWPDVVYWHPGGRGILFRELKGTGGVATAAQARILAELTAAGGDAKVWGPAELRSGEIEATLCGHLP